MCSSDLASIQFNGDGSLVISGNGGVASSPYVLLTTTNLAAPVWTPILTNQFNASGNFFATNPVTSAPQTFYKLQLQ